MWLPLLSVTRLWRIYVPTAVSLLIGGLIGLLSHVHFSHFLSAAAGGSLLGSLGFAVGLVWQFWSTERRRIVPWGQLIYTVVLLGGATIGSSLIGVPKVLADTRALHYFRNMNADCLRRIEVFEKAGGKCIKMIEAHQSLKCFADAMHDVDGVYGFPRIVKDRTYRNVRITTDDLSIELDCQYDNVPNARVTFAIVSHFGAFTRFRCHMISLKLREWFDQYVGDDP